MFYVGKLFFLRKHHLIDKTLQTMSLGSRPTAIKSFKGKYFRCGGAHPVKNITESVDFLDAINLAMLLLIVSRKM